jgi:hypothetical protein
MSLAPRPERRPNPLVGLLDHLGAILLTITIGLVLGLQYITPNKRVIAVLVAIVMFGVTWRLDMVTGLGVLIIALPFPRTTVFGNTNLAFILLLLVTWLLRVTLGQNTPPRRTTIDAPLVTLFVCYIISFYNIDSTALLLKNLVNLEMMVASWLMFYLIASNLRSSSDLGRILNFQAVSVLLICLAGSSSRIQGRASSPTAPAPSSTTTNCSANSVPSTRCSSCSCSSARSRCCSASPMVACCCSSRS